MDVSKDSVAVAVLSPDRDTAEVDRIFHDSDSVRRLVKGLGKPKGIWACDEAGPTGYDLQRLLSSLGVRCDVVAPSLIPKGSGDRVKTDRRGRRATGGSAPSRRTHPGRRPHPRPRGRARPVSHRR
jgi:transposase